MDGIVFDDCPRHSNGDPKVVAQRDRYDRKLCVYCAAPLSADLLGPACAQNVCQAKRWSEVKLTEKQEHVFQGIFQGKQDKQIADEMENKISVHRVKEHIRAIAGKLGVQYNRTLLARCYCDRRENLKSQAATPSPRERTLLQGTPRTRTARN
jgi:DNA-binding CsgD family transcriptional regulator